MVPPALRSPPGVLSATRAGQATMAPMSSPAAELSSLATALDDVAERVTAIAESYASARRDDLATELYQVERALAAARRGLNRVLDNQRPR